METKEVTIKVPVVKTPKVLKDTAHKATELADKANNKFWEFVIGRALKVANKRLEKKGYKPIVLK